MGPDTNWNDLITVLEGNPKGKCKKDGAQTKRKQRQQCKAASAASMKLYIFLF